jgi:hypothetical protein
MSDSETVAVKRLLGRFDCEDVEPDVLRWELALLMLREALSRNERFGGFARFAISNAAAVVAEDHVPTCMHQRIIKARNPERNDEREDDDVAVADYAAVGDVTGARALPASGPSP